MKNGCFLADAKELGFIGGGDGSFGDFVGGLDLNSVIREERLVERFLRIEFVLQVWTKANWNVGGFNAKRN